MNVSARGLADCPPVVLQLFEAVARSGPDALDPVSSAVAIAGPSDPLAGIAVNLRAADGRDRACVLCFEMAAACALILWPSAEIGPGVPVWLDLCPHCLTGLQVATAAIDDDAINRWLAAWRAA